MSDRESIRPDDSPITVSAAPVPLTVEYVPRRLRMLHVSEADLDTVSSLGNSIHWTFFGVCGGAAISFWIVLTTAKVTDPTAHAEYKIGCLSAVLFSVYFGIRGARDYLKARKRLREIKNGR